MKKISLFVTLFFVMLSSVSLAEEPRNWTSRQGTTIEATLLEFKNGEATLQRSDGRILTAKLGQLSQEDQDYLTQREQKPIAASPGSSGTAVEVFAVSVTKEIPSNTRGKRQVTSRNVSPQTTGACAKYAHNVNDLGRSSTQKRL